MMMDNWNRLKPREKQIVFLLVIKERKLTAIADDLGISRSRLVMLVNTIYRVLEVDSRVLLALEIGKNWSTLEPEMREILGGTTR